MLLFSTILDINDTMTKDVFIRLVIEWNQGSPHVENIINGIHWSGERNIRYGEDGKWLDIEEYRNQNIGSKLIKTVENYFKNKGFENINLTTYGFQAPEFYKKCGFKIEFIRENKENSKLNKYFLVKYF